MQFKRVAVDTSKAVFTIHAIDADDRPVLRQDLSRTRFEAFFAKLEPTEFALEACGGSHHWGRRLQACGHVVRLVPPQYARPFVKRGKNDRADAEAISEAAGRPGMRFVPVRAIEHQAEAMVLSVREQLVGQRTALINALRGHAAEFGVVGARGTANVEALMARVGADASIPPAAMKMLSVLHGQIERLDAEIASLDAELKQAAASHAVARRLMKVPGIGPIAAMSLVLTVDAARFADGRHVSAWLGLVPKQRSTGGRTRLGGISRAGNERLRQLLVVGATAVIRHTRPGKPKASPWILRLLQRRPRKLVAIAVANKLGRIVWSMMARGEAYRPRPIPA